MRRLFTPLAVMVMALVLSGCLRVPQQTRSTELGPKAGPEVVVLVSKTGQAARSLMHDVAVNCWLDGIVAGAQMIVEPGGNIGRCQKPPRQRLRHGLQGGGIKPGSFQGHELGV